MDDRMWILIFICSNGAIITVKGGIFPCIGHFVKFPYTPTGNIFMPWNFPVLLYSLAKKLLYQCGLATIDGMRLIIHIEEISMCIFHNGHQWQQTFRLGMLNIQCMLFMVAGPHWYTYFFVRVAFIECVPVPCGYIKTVALTEKKKWSQNSSTLEPFWKTVPLWRVEPFFSLKSPLKVVPK